MEHAPSSVSWFGCDRSARRGWREGGWRGFAAGCSGRPACRTPPVHAVLLLQHQVGEASGEPNGIVVLADRPRARAAVTHRPAAVEQDGATEVGFFFVLADVESIGLGEDFPVDRADFVPLDVLPVLLEFDAESLVGGTVKAGAEPFHDLSGEYLQAGELTQVVRGEEV